ncbi:putative SEP domain-containing protein [Rosa chinensis]|uniref:Putative SEP domain-containing protein n=1 Tax=Rosa chinensis TaxID=74649 RepID=A0A2P6Q2C8_ROSCH|nr:plant UBX domain-containing protein 3 isoform X2 [Rosa chinensis]PRQ28342.1 putative SEP domain-containing protein [Rosa chinensis]
MASQSGFDVDSIFDQARELGTLEGRFDPPSAPQQPKTVVHNIIFWSDGFSVNDGPLRQLDDPENAPFLEFIRKSDCPRELQPEDRSTEVHINLIRRDGKCPGLVVDKSLPWTSIQLKLADGTCMTAEFNYRHTISDIRTFVDTSRPGSPSNYQLLVMGRPPKILNDPTQTIEEADLARSVVIQKF